MTFHWRTGPIERCIRWGALRCGRRANNEGHQAHHSPGNQGPLTHCAALFCLINGWCYSQDGPAHNHLVICRTVLWIAINTEMRYMQDHPAYNPSGYTQDSNLTNLKSNPNPNPLTVTVIRSLICTNQTTNHASCHFTAKKYIIFSVGRLLICIVLWIAITDRSCRMVLRITSALINCIDE